MVYACRADGRRVPVSVSVAPLRDDTGAVVGAIEVFRDESVRLQDMEFARRVQQHTLPEELPGDERIRFEVGYYPHDLVGGDFYGVREVSPGTFAFLVADVRGHGVSAALYTMVLSSHLATLTSLAIEPGKMMTALNEHLGELTVAESFASAAYGVLDSDRWELRYSSAGHPPFLLLDAGTGHVKELETHGLFLGMFGPADYEESTLPLPERGVLLAYSDGAIEVRNKDGEEFGIEGLSHYLSQHGARADFPDRFYHYLSQYNADVSLADDLLVLVGRLEHG